MTVIRCTCRRLALATFAAVLVLGNGLSLHPERWSAGGYRFILFSPIRVGAPGLTVVAEQRKGDVTVEVFDPAGVVAPVTLSPFPGLREYLERRWTRAAVRHGRLAIHVRDEEGNEWCAGEYNARDFWVPEPPIDFRFLIGGRLRLPPGEYEIHAVLFADPPCGTGHDGNARLDPTSYREWIAPRAPGSNIFLDHATSDPVRLTIP